MSGICGAAQTRRTAGALDEQKAPKPTDRAVLERAIDCAQAYGDLDDSWKTVIAAACAHLATLPEPSKTKMVEVKRWVTFRYACSGPGDGPYILNLAANQHETHETGERGQWVTFNVEVPA